MRPKIPRAARSLGATVLVVMLLRSFVVQAYRIPSGSMIPTLAVGDRVLVAKFVYGLSLPFVAHKVVPLSQPRPGEVIVFRHPRDPEVDLIKRVVAVAGDTVAVIDDVVYVNGQPKDHDPLPGPCHYLDFEEVADQWSAHDCDAFAERLGRARFTTIQQPGGSGPALEPTVVPAGHVFVLGDHRDRSADSRYFGPVPLDLIRGRAFLVGWSVGEPEGLRLGRFLTPIR